MVRVLLTCALLALPAGCGGDEPQATAPAVTATATVDPASATKADLRVAASHMEVHYTEHQTYTSDRAALDPSFPTTVTVTEASKAGYTLEARTAEGARFRFKTDAGITLRTCAPAAPPSCHGGTW